MQVLAFFPEVTASLEKVVAEPLGYRLKCALSMMGVFLSFIFTNQIIFHPVKYLHHGECQTNGLLVV